MTGRAGQAKTHRGVPPLMEGIKALIQVQSVTIWAHC